MANDPDSRNELASDEPGDDLAAGDQSADSQALPAESAELADGEASSADVSSSETAEDSAGGGDLADGAVEPSAEASEPEGDPAGDTQSAEEEPAADEEPAVDTAEDATDSAESDVVEKQWYILKVQVNREESIRKALDRRVKVAGLEEFFGDIVVPTEDVAEFNKSGKRRIVKKKLYPGYIMVHLALNDDTWFLVRETPGIGDFTGSAGKPTPMAPHEVQRIIKTAAGEEASDSPIKTAIPFKPGDRVRVKEGYFENFEGDVESIDEANGRVTVMINIFGRSTPVELEHWQIEAV